MPRPCRMRGLQLVDSWSQKDPKWSAGQQVETPASEPLAASGGGHPLAPQPPRPTKVSCPAPRGPVMPWLTEACRPGHQGPVMAEWEGSHRKNLHPTTRSLPSSKTSARQVQRPLHQLPSPSSMMLSPSRPLPRRTCSRTRQKRQPTTDPLP